MNKALGCIVFCLVVASAAWAGNAELMEKRAQELIRLNEEIIRGLDVVGGDGRVTLEARVVQPPDGEKVIYIDRVSVSATPEASENVLESTADYQSAIRIGPIPQSERFDPYGMQGGGAALSGTEWDGQAFRRWLDAHPSTRVIELKGAALESLPLNLPSETKQGFLLYW